MAEPAIRSAWGDADARTRDVLDAAAVLLDEGGYPALTMRALAERAGMSPGLIYQYFKNKEDVFAALLGQHQVRLTAFLRALPRDVGVRDVLRAVVPETTEQWNRVGRLAGTWRAGRAPDPLGDARRRDLLSTTAAQFGALRAALADAAIADGTTLRDDPALVPFVWAGLMGLADHLVNGWARGIDEEAFVDFAVDGLARGITTG